MVGSLLATGFVVALGLCVALLPQLELASAIVVAERRPPLLADARWNDSASAKLIVARFAPGTASGDLLGWLAANRFAINRGAGTAQRHIASLPCNEDAIVTWREQDGKLVRVSALVREAGCL